MDLLQRTANRIRKNLRQGWDAFIIIDGMERTGKSVLLLKLAKLIDYDFTLNNVIYRQGKWKELIYSRPRYAAIGHDEFGLDAFSREAMTKHNRELVKTVMVCGNQNKALLACVPNFWWLDAYIKYHRVTLWIHVYHIEYMGERIRGFAKFREPIHNDFGKCPYFQYKFTYRFNNLDQKTYELYEAHKNRNIESLLNEEGDGGNISPFRTQLIKAWHKDGLTQQEIVNRLPDKYKITRRRVGQIVQNQKGGKEGSNIHI